MKNNRRWSPASAVRIRYGGISDMTLWRWTRDPELDFPKPAYIGRYRYWDDDELDAFDEAKLAAREAAA